MNVWKFSSESNYSLILTMSTLGTVNKFPMILSTGLFTGDYSSLSSSYSSCEVIFLTSVGICLRIVYTVDSSKSNR